MAKGCSKNNYEEARNLRVEENKKKIQDLGIATISKDLAGLASASARKSPLRTPKPKAKTNTVVEPRRSSRARNPVPSYNEIGAVELPPSRKRSRMSDVGRYAARPLDEIKLATYEERNHAWLAAEALERNLRSANPSFIKSMVRSHVYSCFWLGLPSEFCVQHLPKGEEEVFMILEDENGLEYESKYIPSRAGFSAGWRRFALDHKLDDGDALVFELVEPLKFKVYIVRAFPNLTENDGENSSEKEGKVARKAAPKASMKKQPESSKTKKRKLATPSEFIDLTSSEEIETENNIGKEVQSKKKVVSTRKTRGSQEPKAAAKPKPQAKKVKKAGEGKYGVPSKNGLVKFAEIDLNKEPVDDETKSVSKAPRKKPAPKLFRKRA